MTQRQFGWSAFRFWLSRQNPMFGLLIATAIIAVLFVLFLRPSAPPDELVGTVVRFGLVESDTGSYPMAVVSVAGTQATVGISRNNRCRIGGSIRLLRYHTLLGGGLRAATVACSDGPMDRDGTGARVTESVGNS